ncbi:hypothetical protein BZZ01_13520 [Nostocales cyanobacterium HT-58-2]|nr:hypothetical protein BZZ01_13520 [Nostocales cyanobacterium HT-58-2]
MKEMIRKSLESVYVGLMLGAAACSLTTAIGITMMANDWVVYVPAHTVKHEDGEVSNTQGQFCDGRGFSDTCRQAYEQAAEINQTKENLTRLQR